MTMEAAGEGSVEAEVAPSRGEVVVLKTWRYLREARVLQLVQRADATWRDATSRASRCGKKPVLSVG